MRINLSIQAPEQSADVLVDCDDQTPIAELSKALAALVPGADPVIDVPAAQPAPDGVVADLGLLDGMQIGVGGPAPRLPELPHSGWMLEVVSGPDSGHIFALPAGDHVLGRSGVMSFLDNALSRQHCKISVSPAGATVTDLASSNGTRLDGELLAPNVATSIELGQMLSIGHSVVTICPARTSDAATETAEEGHAHFLRPPRMLPHHLRPTVEVPKPPHEQSARRFPVIALAVPLVFGCVMALVMSPRFLLFALMSPLMMGANYFSEQRSGAKEHRKALAKYTAELEASQTQLTELTGDEQQRLREEMPDPADTFLTCVLPGRRLWERRRHDADSLLLRVGTADIASTVQITGETKGQDSHTLHSVPVGIPLAEAGVVGVAGPADAVVGLLRWMLVQLCAYHPTRDLTVSLITSRTESHWQWVRWLPHLRSGDPEGSPAFIGNDQDTTSAQINQLVAQLTARKAAVKGTNGVKASSFPAHVLIVHGYRSVRTTLGLSQLLDEGPTYGIYAICTDEEERLLPEKATQTVLCAHERPDYALVRRTGQPNVTDVLVEGVSAPWCERLARSISPLVDMGGDADEAMLPDSARLLDVLGFDPPEANAIRAKWALEPRSTAMTIGVGLDGNFTLDLRRDGPHALVAGTTGSGKTELLQTMIGSLALANRPDELNFVLVDYKGDSAFKDCVHLPHTVGKVNDLDPHLVERALESLSAELRYREHFFAEAAVKDIEDYQLLQAREPHRPSLPRLLLIIDEFAALFKELPDFVSGLVGIAQRGRSLGIHLILATQRPSGVVSPEIRANTNLRIALRVTDAADSVDVLNGAEAAGIAKSSPGRGFARLGAGSLLSFQSGRVGGRRPGAVAAEVPPPFVARIDWKGLGYRMPQLPKAAAHDDVADTDLAGLVRAVVEAAAADGVPEQRQPWLPALPEVLTLDEVYADVATSPALPAMPGLSAPSALPALPYGVRDLPADQRQEAATFNLETDDHLLVIGAARSGRSQVLRSLAGSIGKLTSPADVHLYGIDCGNGALNPFTTLPHCGAVASRNEPDRVGRLLGRIGAEMDRRQLVFAEHGFADIGEQRRSGSSPFPHIVVVLDRWEGFVTSLGDLDGGALTDGVSRLLREGASLGVHAVISGDRTLANNRISSMTESKFTLRLADKADYTLVGLSPRNIPDRLPPGRGFTTAGIETQVMLLTADDSGQAQAAALARIGEECRVRVGEVAREQLPFRLDALPNRITLAEALALRSPDSAEPFLMLGVGGDELAAFSPDLARTSSFLVAGPNRSGRSTVLKSAALSLLETGAKVICVAPRPSPLRDLAQTPGVLAVFTDGTTSAEAYDEIFDVAGGPVVVILDDAEDLKDAAAGDLFAKIVKGNLDKPVFLLIGGQIDGLSQGFSGWHVEARKSRQGLLLSPQGISDGDLIGVRVPRSALGQPIQPGRALLHLGDGGITRIATAFS